jgi:hypothetical protein
MVWPSGERHGGVVNHAAVGAFHAPGDRGAGLVESGDARGEPPPHRLVVLGTAADRHDLGHMRTATEEPFVEGPDLREGRVVEAQATI